MHPKTKQRSAPHTTTINVVQLHLFFDFSFFNSCKKRVHSTTQTAFAKQRPAHQDQAWFFSASSCGGALEGGGVAVATMTKTTTTVGRGIACGEGCVSTVLKVGFNALSVAHKGQSKVWLPLSSDRSSPITTNCMPLALVQTNSIPCGFANGEAMAPPSDNANHTSTRRVI
jgi:hypothetical protein